MLTVFQMRLFFFSFFFAEHVDLHGDMDAFATDFVVSRLPPHDAPPVVFDAEDADADDDDDGDEEKMSEIEMAWLSSLGAPPKDASDLVRCVAFKFIFLVPFQRE